MPWMLYTYRKPHNRRAFGMMRWVRNPSTGRHSYRRPLSNDPNRAKGMQAFEIEGRVVYAGTEGGARKLLRRMKAMGA